MSRSGLCFHLHWASACSFFITTAFAAQATALLFGNVLAVERSPIAILAGLGVATLTALAAIMRPLVFASLQPELAEAKGVPLRLVSIAFLVIVAMAVSECAQIVGVLLVFTLMVGSAAAAQQLTTGLWSRLTLSAGPAQMPGRCDCDGAERPHPHPEQSRGWARGQGCAQRPIFGRTQPCV
jgi:ABC-type Mn2+/Zn2+ transport system permease subunit